MNTILLIKPAYNFFPMGLAYVMAALRHHGIPYDFVDLLFPDQGWEERLHNGEYMAVASGGLIGDLHSLMALSQKVRGLSPRTPLILGGNITFDLPRSILFNLIQADYAVIGEAELTFPELLANIRRPSKPFHEIAGIAFRDGAGLPVFTPARKRINLREMDLHPVWENINLDHYLETGVGGFPGFRAMPVLTGRGCTGKCTFCSPTNGYYRMREFSSLMDELLALNSRYDFEGFAFITEIFYPTGKLIRRFLDAYRRTGIDKPWVCLLRVDVDDSIINDMKLSGCRGISFGAESGSDWILATLRKKTTVETIKKFYQSTRSAGIPAFGSFMLGNEGETEKEMAQTIDLLIKEDIAGPCGMVITYPGTQIYKNAVENGRIIDEEGYIKNIDFSQILQNGIFRNVNYLNISGIHDPDMFFATIIRQYRRYSSNLFKKMTALNIDMKNLTGLCPACGEKMDIPFRANTILGMESFCPQCFRLVYFDLYHHMSFLNHLDTIRSTLAANKKIALIGTGVNARLFHLYDPFTIPIEHIDCHVDLDGSWQGDFFFNFPVIALEQLRERDPDCVLIADSYSVKNTLRRLREAGVDPQRILALLPPGWLPFIKKLVDTTAEGQLLGLLDHSMSMTLPPVGSIFFKWLASDISKEILTLAHHDSLRIAVIPAGGFAVALAQNFSPGIRLTAFMDNFKTGGNEKAINGTLLCHPREARSLSFDKILIATPSYTMQKKFRDQLLDYPGIQAKDLLLFSDLFLQSELGHVQSEHE